ncbi:minor tail protein [Streptomyces phage OzzyJ]|uniref:Minor tail protein n=1 Tax=Streptomyces phage Werner TaxID=2801898 RepID=A0A7U0GCY2_9CAUD|nr:minor tail protein [Streptomyces phage Werner]AVE00402.1 minor tail protein [Streptomyces phage OzzyJ]QAY17702.1 minor tail protein [Streptomyces phage Asten]QFP95187.1 minor tail protein [Streptomyces phage Whatever]QQO39942.1 minor tail protein [Streptomyces phage Dwayne]QYW07204.1 minor tail protein [Streptomyces phage Chucky]UKH48522.1 minor tail protein [Streptomyces phage Snorlax]WAB09802.1 minor tail protein [Streptomyces phage TagePhighter]
MKLGDLTVEVRNKDLERVGAIRPEELILELEDTFNNVGTWKLTLSVEHPLANALRSPGSGVIITGATDILMSGPMVKNEYASTPEDPGGSIVFEGISDTCILSDYLAFPDPTNIDPTTQTKSHDVRTGTVEAVMHSFVNANCGPGAPAARRKANLILAAHGNRGSETTKSARFAVLGNVLTELGLRASLGFRVVQRGSDLVFETYQVTDRSAYIRLDVMNNTLSGSRVAITPPSATRVIVAGQGEMVDRKFREITTAESLAGEVEWGRRIERWQDQRNTNEDDELDDSGMEILEEEGFTSVSAQAVPMEDSAVEFGRDWTMGDRVSVVVNDQELTAVVTGMILRATSDGFRVGAVIGDATGFNADAAYSKRVQNTETRVSELERNGSSGGGVDDSVFRIMGVW